MKKILFLLVLAMAFNGCINYSSYPTEEKDVLHMKCTQVNSFLLRCANSEVICYLQTQSNGDRIDTPMFCETNYLDMFNNGLKE